MTAGKMLGDWKRACTLRTLVDSAFGGSQALASFFSAPMSFADSGNAITSTTSQKPTTIHLVQLPAGISVSLLATLFIAAPRCLLTVSERHQADPRPSARPQPTAHNPIRTNCHAKPRPGSPATTRPG